MIGTSRPASLRTIALLLAALLGSASTLAASQGQTQSPRTTLVPVEEISPALLGIYRKLMRIEPEIERYAALYDVDVQLAKAVCLYESGGNGSLTSIAGAQGYFQVMPATFRLMRVPTNVEAGIKYLGTLVRQFGREDYALAAYNGGPTRVARGRAMPLESLQYVIGVGHYRTVLKAHEPSVRAHALRLKITHVADGDDWWTMSVRTGIPVIQLRLYNPFLAARPLRTGATIVYPPTPRDDLFDLADRSHYRVRLGDNYIKLAFALNLNLDRLRQVNGLWHLQSMLPGTMLEIPSDETARYERYTVGEGDSITAIAERFDVDPWTVLVDNQLWDETVQAGQVISVRRRPQVAAPVQAAVQVARIRTHRVRRGETLSGIARRYNTSVAALQAVNGLGRRTMLKANQRLRIPTAP